MVTLPRWVEPAVLGLNLVVMGALVLVVHPWWLAVLADVPIGLALGFGAVVAFGRIRW
jgi:hypothetical protein